LLAVNCLETEPALNLPIVLDPLLARQRPESAAQSRIPRVPAAWPGHLLRQPRNEILEIAGVMRAHPRPWDRLGAHPAVWAPHPPKLALDPASAGAEIEMPPPLDPAAVNMPGELPASRAHPPAAPQPDSHDHPPPLKLTSMTDAPGRRRSRLNAVVTRTSPSLLAA
jgi:hypothetical protein